ncbi:MAG: hypothetical protein ACKOYL_12160 [Actinomycetota bacterium]
MKRELPPGYREQLELGYVFGSTLTFGQRPLVPDAGMLAEWEPDVAIIGASGTSGRCPKVNVLPKT